MRYVCGRYKHLGRDPGARVRGVGAALVAFAARGSPECTPETLDAAVLGGLAVDDVPELSVLAIDAVLPVFLSDTPPILELRTGFVVPDLSVTASLPSCVAAPSRRSWTKYGPHRRATTRELTGMRSPETHRISMSASSRIASAFSPSSSDARECALPPAVHPALRAALSPSPA